MKRPVLLVLLLVVAGCKSYDPEPLDPRRELAVLRGVDLARFTVEHARPGTAPVGSATFDVTDGLDEAELVALGLTINPAIRARRFGTEEARSHLVTAGLWPNPVFALAWQPGVMGAPSFSAEGAWLLEVVRVWERGARIDAAEARVGETEAEVVAAEWRLVALVRTRHRAVLVQERLLGMLEEEAGLRRRAVDLVRRGHELGEVRDLDLALARLELAEVERDVRRARTEAETARRELNRALGLSPDTSLPLAEARRPLAFVVFEDLDEAGLDDRLLAGRFELRAKERAYERSEHELRMAVYRQYPPLGVGPSFSRQPEKTYYVGPVVLLELPIFNQNQGEIAESEAARSRARLEYVALLHELRADAHEALALLRRARLEVEAQEREVLPVVARAEALLEAGLASGDVRLLDWIAARRRALEARREYVASLTRYHEAVIRVETTTGVALAPTR